jgi:two-component system, chemotaxis family, protein-glutamate methylesterase/glutaminase
MLLAVFVEAKWPTNRFERILIGGSAGSLALVEKLLSGSPWLDLPPIVYACHIMNDNSVNQMCELLAQKLPLNVSIATPGGELVNNNLYLAPAGYHILLEENGTTFRYFDDGPFLSSKPSINLFFMSCCGREARTTLAIICGGANSDGAEGIRALKLRGASCAVADPEHCQFDMMPKAAIKALDEFHIIPHSSERKWLEKML